MARTTAPARWQRVQTLAPPSPASAPVGSSPIYEQLTREWAAAGRTLPGLPDLEWNRLAHYPPRPGSDTESRPASASAAASAPSRRGWLHERG